MFCSMFSKYKVYIGLPSLNLKVCNQKVLTTSHCKSLFWFQAMYMASSTYQVDISLTITPWTKWIDVSANLVKVILNVWTFSMAIFETKQWHPSCHYLQINSEKLLRAYSMSGSLLVTFKFSSTQWTQHAHGQIFLCPFYWEGKWGSAGSRVGICIKVFLFPLCLFVP